MKFNMEFYEEKKVQTNDNEIENIKEYIENTDIQKNYEKQFLNIKNLYMQLLYLLVFIFLVNMMFIFSI